MPVKVGFHMIATIAVIAGKNIQQSLQSCGKHSSAIVVKCGDPYDR